MNAHNQRLVLTGASGGIGQAIARTLAPRCAAMILIGRDATKLDALRNLLQAQHSALDVHTVCGDLSVAATRDQVLAASVALSGPIDLLINNAGINAFHAFESQPGANIERVLAVNLLAPMQLTQHLLPVLLRAPRAQIVNIGSIFGYLGYPGFAAYCASKFGLRGYSQALRRELADTAVTVRYFAPRATRTALNTPAIAALNHALHTREDSPDDVARMLAHFLDTSAWERKLGFPERLYVFLNQLLPAVTDGAIRAQLQTIRAHLPEAPPRVTTIRKGARP